MDAQKMVVFAPPVRHRMCRAETTDHNFCGRDTAQLSVEVRPMKYHLSAWREATPSNWKILLHAFARMPDRMDEPFVRAILEKSWEVNITRNQRDEMLAFLDSIWDPRFRSLSNPTFATSEPHRFRLVRQRWAVKITLSYDDGSGLGSPREKIHLAISSKDPEAVRTFVKAAAEDHGQMWYGSLHYDDNHSPAPQTAFEKSVDEVVDALIELARQEAEKLAEKATVTA